MLDNMVNRHDLERVWRLTRLGRTDRLLSKLRVRGTARVVEHWAELDPSRSQWWAVPAVVQRWNRLMTGDAAVPFPQYVADKYLLSKWPLRGLSLGCGVGGNEVVWARTGAFRRLRGVDVSPQRVAAATTAAEAAGLDDVLEFHTADVNRLADGGERFNVLLGLQSLHHFDRLFEAVRRLAALLEPGGLFVVDEFVGPTRFQWTDGQLEAANALLADLPPERRRLPDGRIKQRVVRPSRLSMVLDDPSEAVDASSLLPALRGTFDILEERPYGGTVLHIALSGIAHHFADQDSETLELLDRCFEAEDRALPELGHDFTALVARARG